MSIISIETIYQDNGNIYVSAMLEDAVQTYGQTYYSPSEYGPALCEASFSVDDDEILPDNDCELIEYLERLDLEWNLVDNSDDEIGLTD